MRVRTVLQLLAPVALLGLLSACAADVADDDAAEQEQALVAARQAAESAAADASAEAAPPPSCDASQVQGLVGGKADEATAAQARSDAGAARVRILAPGQVVTMEFDGARLNLEVDDAGSITAARCG